MIDELKRKKFLEQLAGRTPSSDEVQMDAIDVYGKDKEEPVVYNNEEPNALTPTPDREGISRTNALTDMVVGAAPTLLGFLSGNYNRIAMGTDTSNRYLKQKAEEDKITSKDLVKVMRNGKPIYLPAKEAVDQEVPAMSLGKSGGAAKSFTNYDAYDPETGERFPVLFNSREGLYLNPDGTPAKITRSTILKPVAEKIAKTTDVRGTESINLINQYAKNPTRVVKSEPGLGKYYDVGTKGQAENIEKAQGRGQQEYEAISGSIVDASASEKTIRNSNDPRAISAAIYSLVRSVEPKGVLTEQDFQVISGNSFMPTYEEILQFISKKGTGNLGDIKKSYLGLAADIKNRLTVRQESIPSRFGTNQGMGAKNGVESVIPGSKRVTAKNKAAFIQAKSAAEKRWGPSSDFPKPDILNKFLQQKKTELGIE